MLPSLIAFWLSLATGDAAAAAADLPKPTLEFNVSLSLGSLLKYTGLEYGPWVSVYANTESAPNGTVGRGPSRLVARSRSPSLSFEAAARNVYVYGDLGVNSRGISELEVSSKYGGNSSSRTFEPEEPGLLGNLTDLEWSKDNSSSFSVISRADEPTISEIIVTTGIESTA